MPKKEQEEAKIKGAAFWGEVLEALENQQVMSGPRAAGLLKAKTIVAIGSGSKGLTIHLYRKH